MLRAGIPYAMAGWDADLRVAGAAAGGNVQVRRRLAAADDGDLHGRDGGVGNRGAEFIFCSGRADGRTGEGDSGLQRLSIYCVPTGDGGGRVGGEFSDHATAAEVVKMRRCGMKDAGEPA